MSAATLGFQLVGSFGCVLIIEQDPRSRTAKQLHARSTDPARSTGNNRNAALQ
jgi:hypothetical protein